MTKNKDLEFSKFEIYPSEAKIKNRLDEKFCFGPQNIITKFQAHLSQKLLEEIDFKADFREIAIKVRVCIVILLLYVFCDLKIQ